MSICANRPPTATTCVICKCGAEVKAELEEAQRDRAERRPNDNGGRG